LRGTPRYALAANDADLSHIPEDFSCAAGVAIGKDTTPRLYALLGRTMIDVGLSTYGAKNKYQRVRPFVVHSEGTCYPKDEPLLRNDGSYPSGHSAIGWGLALVLVEIEPARANALVQRGRDFGQSRVVCEAHWQSDIDAGRVIAAATVARLHANTAFQVDVAAARVELMSAKAPDGAACAAEAAALAG
jgi:acid phosphatase (class A)